MLIFRNTGGLRGRSGSPDGADFRTGSYENAGNSPHSFMIRVKWSLQGTVSMGSHAAWLTPGTTPKTTALPGVLGSLRTISVTPAAFPLAVARRHATRKLRIAVASSCSRRTASASRCSTSKAERLSALDIRSTHHFRDGGNGALRGCSFTTYLRYRCVDT